MAAVVVGGIIVIGIIIPSFRIALAMEEAEWKPFRKALNKSDRKKFDEIMFKILDCTSLSLLLDGATYKALSNTTDLNPAILPGAAERLHLKS